MERMKNSNGITLNDAKRRAEWIHEQHRFEKKNPTDKGMGKMVTTKLFDVSTTGDTPRTVAFETKTSGDVISMRIHTTNVVKTILHRAISGAKEMRIGERRVEVTKEGTKTKIKLFDKEHKNARGTVTMLKLKGPLTLECSTKSIIKEGTTNHTALEWVWKNIIKKPFLKGLVDAKEGPKRDDEIAYHKNTVCTVR